MREYKVKKDVKEFMKENNIKQKDIKDKIGITQSYLSQIINGKKTKISRVVAYAFCKALDSEFEIEDVFEIF